jgi:hypothetical protein
MTYWSRHLYHILEFNCPTEHTTLESLAGETLTSTNIFAKLTENEEPWKLFKETCRVIMKKRQLLEKEYELLY